MNPLRRHLDRVLFSEREIEGRVQELGLQISKDYGEEEEVTLLIILKGSVLFAADLMQATPLIMELECLRVSSYHGGTESSGQVDMEDLPPDHLKGKHVLVVDDILDTGRTLQAVSRYLMDSAGARSVRSCVLLDKEGRRAVDFEADYVGFPIGNEFVVGYGLDFRGRYRNLPLIGVLKPDHIEL